MVAVIGVLIASFLVSTTDAHEDYFRADRAWFYIVLLSIGYMVRVASHFRCKFGLM